MNKKLYFAIPFIVPTLLSALTLTESVDSVLKTNPEYLERVKNFNVVREEVDISYSGYLPKLDLRGASGTETISAPATSNEEKTFQRIESEIVISQNIFNGFGDKNEIERQKMRLTSAAYSVLEKANDIALKMTKEYINVLRNKDLLSVTKKNAGTHEKYYNQVKERTDSGFGTRSEVEQVGSRLALANSALILQEIGYKDSLASFARIYGDAYSIDTLQKPDFKTVLPTNFEEAYSLALKQNPSIKINIYDYKAAQQNYEKNAQAYFPKIDLELKKSNNENVSGVEGENDSTSMMLRVSYNLFNGIADSSNRQKSISLIHQENEKRNITQRKVKENLRQSWNGYTLITKQMSYLKNHVELAQSTVSSYVEEFKLGRRNLLDLLIAESEHNEAKQSLTNGEYDLLYSKYKIQNATGSLLGMFEVDLPTALGLSGEKKINIKEDKYIKSTKAK